MRKKGLLLLSLIAYSLLMIGIVKVKIYKYENSSFAINSKAINFSIDATSAIVYNASSKEILYQKN